MRQASEYRLTTQMNLKKKKNKIERQKSISTFRRDIGVGISCDENIHFVYQCISNSSS